MGWGSYWKPSDWRNLNCQIFADKEKADTTQLDEMQKYKKYKNLCHRQKAMYGLEHSAFIINASFPKVKHFTRLLKIYFFVTIDPFYDKIKKIVSAFLRRWKRLFHNLKSEGFIHEKEL